MLHMLYLVGAEVLGGVWEEEGGGNKIQKMEVIIMPYGQGSGRGWGFGFRGYSPPWPYVGRGRGGLPRCWAYLPEGYYGAGYPYPEELQFRGMPGFWPPVPPDQEVAILKNQAEVLKQQLERIDARVKDLEKTGQESKTTN